LGAGRYDEAFADLSRLLAPADPAYQIALSGCCVAELTEAAVRAGQTDAMHHIVRDLESLAESHPHRRCTSG
jgi:hypothetical protein